MNMNKKLWMRAFFVFQYFTCTLTFVRRVFLNLLSAIVTKSSQR